MQTQNLIYHVMLKLTSCYSVLNVKCLKSKVKKYMTGKGKNFSEKKLKFITPITLQQRVITMRISLSHRREPISMS